MSSDVHVNAIQAIFRVFIQCSLLLPYTLLREFDSSSHKTILALKIIAILTSPLIFIIFYTFTRKLGFKETCLLILLLAWVVTIRSYSYHHTHIIGSGILLYYCVMLTITPKNNYYISNLFKSITNKWRVGVLGCLSLFMLIKCEIKWK